MMKLHLIPFLCLLLLCGCGPATDAATTVTSIPTTVQTEPTAPTTVQTLPPTVEEQYAYLMDSMDTGALVGQLFLARFPGWANAEEALKNYPVGGFILFSRDFSESSIDEINEAITDLQRKSDIPLLIATDEEGGSVCRVSSHSQFRDRRFPSPRKLYETGGMDALIQGENEKCALLSKLGINVNMAPVCDITTDSDAFMYQRSLGLDPQTTGQCISNIVQTMNEAKIGSVLKHFPGYGNNTDTHVGIATDDRSLTQLEQCDLVPFRAGIEADCGAVLVSHTIVQCLDDVYPASMSPAVIGYLRQTLSFDGVIVTDDLVMDAISDSYGAGEAAVLAVLAGNDLLCSSEYAVQYDAVLAAVNSGRISQEQLRRSVARILQWKDTLGLLQEGYY